MIAPFRTSSDCPLSDVIIRTVLNTEKAIRVTVALDRWSATNPIFILCLLQDNHEGSTFDELQECYQGLMG